MFCVKIVIVSPYSIEGRWLLVSLRKAANLTLDDHMPVSQKKHLFFLEESQLNYRVMDDETEIGSSLYLLQI